MTWPCRTGPEEERARITWHTCAIGLPTPLNGLVVVAQSIGHDFGLVSSPTSTAVTEQHHMAVTDLSMGVAEMPSFMLGGNSEDQIEGETG